MRVLRISALDRAISFNPAWVWVYESVYFLIDPLPLLATTRGQLRRYSTGFILICFAAFSLFALFPVQGPRPTTSAANFLYRWQTRIDTPLNAMPSLHAALAVYTVLFVRRIGLGSARVMTGLTLWTALILYSLVAIKAHYAVDVLAGAALAVVADSLVWLGSGSETVSTPVYRESSPTSG